MNLYRLYIGSRHEEGIFAPAELRGIVVATLQPRFPSFTLMEGEGWFCGVSEHGLTALVATEDLSLLLGAAAELRAALRQEGIGIEFASRYHRLTEGCNLADLAREILGCANA